MSDQEKFSTSNLCITDTGSSGGQAKITFSATGKLITKARTIRVIVGNSKRNIVINFLGRSRVYKPDDMTTCP